MLIFFMWTSVNAFVVFSFLLGVAFLIRACPRGSLHSFSVRLREGGSDSGALRFAKPRATFKGAGGEIAAKGHILGNADAEAPRRRSAAES